MRRWAFAALIVGVVAVATGRADSLWERRDPRYAFLFQDNRARNIGDTLIVTVLESTIANEQDQKSLNRATASSGNVQVFGGAAVTQSANGGTTLNAPGVGFAFPSQTSNMSFNGNAQNTVAHVFNDQMAVTVVDMMPNGNLVIEGYRSRVVQGEERVLRVTGIVRQADIGVGNVIASGSVANFRISYLGRGPTTRTTKQGYLGRLGNLLRPF